MKKNFFEAIIGTLVLICAAFFIVTSFNGSSITKTDGYKIIAKFNNSDGISIGSDVKISGVKIAIEAPAKPQKKAHK